MFEISSSGSWSKLTATYHSFTGQVKLHSILIRTSNSSSAPQTLKVFINRDDIDFSTANELAPTQEFGLSQTSEIQDIPVKRALFGKVQNLTLFVEDNYGDDGEFEYMPTKRYKYSREYKLTAIKYF